MKKLLILLLAAVITATFFGCSADTPETADTTEAEKTTAEITEQVSQDGGATTAADFTVLDENESDYTFSPNSGKPTVIHFWSTKQKSCKTELEYYNELSPEYEGEVNFMLIHLTDRDKENLFHAKAFMLENGYTFPVYFDLNGEAAKVYKVKEKPVTVFIDKDGNIYETFEGEMTEPLLKGYIERTINE